MTKLFSLILPLIMVICCSENKISDPEPSSNSSQSLKSMKGWELYSWQQADNWDFSLVPGTNRIKTYEEITSEKSKIGLETLKHELGQLAKDEEIFWLINQVSNMSLPPNEIVDKVKTYCTEYNLKLYIIK